MFYAIYKHLCDAKGISCTRAAVEMGLSNATPTKWKQTGAMPDTDTLTRVSEYFDTPMEYLLGLTPDANRISTEYDLSQARAKYEKETDPGKKTELAVYIDTLNESLQDQFLIANLTKAQQKHKPPQEFAPISDSELKFALFGNTDEITDDDLADVKRYAAFILSRKEVKRR